MREIFEIVWNRIVTNAGSVFYTKLEKTFSYKIEDCCFIPLRPDKAPKVTKEYVRMAYLGKEYNILKSRGGKYRKIEEIRKWVDKN